jgi:hypothetical protein
MQGPAGVLASGLSGCRDVGFRGGGLAGDVEEGAGPVHEPSGDRRHLLDPVLERRRRHRGRHPVTFGQGDRRRVAHDGGADAAMKELGLRREAQVHGARGQPCPIGDVGERGGGVAALDEELRGGLDEAGFRLGAAGGSTVWLDGLGHLYAV